MAPVRARLGVWCWWRECRGCAVRRVLVWVQVAVVMAMAMGIVVAGRVVVVGNVSKRPRNVVMVGVWPVRPAVEKREALAGSRARRHHRQAS